MFASETDYLSPKGRAQLRYIEEYIKTNMPSDAMGEWAFFLAGRSPDEIEEGIGCFCREIVEGLERLGVPKDTHLGFMVAAGNILRERIAEFRALGVGRA